MAWSHDVPDGTKPLNQIDDDLRANSAFLETSVGAEHYFAHGGSQTGRHKIGIGDSTARDAAIATPASGNLWLDNTSISTDSVYTLQAYDGSAWTNVGFIDPNAAFLDKTQKFTRGIAGNWDSFTDADPNLTWSVDGGNMFRFVFPAASGGSRTISNPTGSQYVNGNSGAFTFVITQDATFGNGTISFDTDFLPAFGAQPAIQQGVNKSTLVHLTLTMGPKLVYSVEWY